MKQLVTLRSMVRREAASSSLMGPAHCRITDIGVKHVDTAMQPHPRWFEFEAPRFPEGYARCPWKSAGRAIKAMRYGIQFNEAITGNCDEGVAARAPRPPVPGHP
jgi:hypothetical protein